MDIVFNSADNLYGTASSTTLWTIGTSITGELTLHESLKGIQDGNVMEIMLDPDDVLYASVFTARSPPSTMPTSLQYQQYT